MSYVDITVDHLPSLIAEKQPVLLDMRDEAAFTSGHLEGAVPADEAQIRRLLKQRAQPVLLYCYHGHSSRDLASFLCQMGMTSVYNLNGGWHALATHAAQQPDLASAALRQWLGQHGFRGSPVYARINRGMTTLMVAALDGDKTILSELLEAGVPINAENSDGNQALWFACVSANIPVLEQLLAAGADADHINQNGYTCLMYAASTGKLDIIDVLLAAGANVEVQNPEGLNALECAATLPTLKRLRAHFPAH